MRNLVLPSKRKAGRWMAQASKGFVCANLLSAFPPIIQTFSAEESLGCVCMTGPHLARYRVRFLLVPTWSSEVPGRAELFADLARRYQEDYPRHKLTFLSATDRETELMRAQGCDAITLNHNCFVNEAIFKPLAEIAPKYDAIYNARLVPYKRHELAASVDSLALLYYSQAEPSVADFRALYARATALLPRAHFLNALTAEGCCFFDKPQVNQALALARVGLCLSKTEGAMLASMEYLLAGLSVVSTPSLGGRDYFFDNEFCLICDPDPRSVREAVEALIARDVPRDYVRGKTLARIEVMRQHYINFVQDLIERAGGKMRFDERFRHLLNGPHGFVHWRQPYEFAALAKATIAAANPWPWRPAPAVLRPDKLVS